MTVEIRPMKERDVESCGRICYEAFKSIADRHQFRPDFPSQEVGIHLARAFHSSSHVFGVVAESEGKIAGSNFLWEFNAIRAVGPITVDPQVQAKGTGRKLMEAVLERGRESIGVRLVQDSFNTASLSLYASLGFDVKEPLVLIEGAITADPVSNVQVRPLEPADYDECAELCHKFHGFDRLNELKNGPMPLESFVAVRDRRLTAYVSAPHFWALNHAVAETDRDMQALLIGVGNLRREPLSFLLPTRNANLFRWCLKEGMRVVKPMTLMAMGEYLEPRGAYLPSVGY